jgi:acetolactate synthase-1/2/3 large subunit
MDASFSRRGLLQGIAAVGGAFAASSATAGPFHHLQAARHPGWVFGRMTGAQALTEALLLEGTGCVYGIPGAQENELWDTFKQKQLPYLLVTHEYSAACMADGYARSTGRPGVLCVVPGPGITNCLTGLGEALLDSSPIVAIVGDVGIGEKAKPFQVHALANVDLLRPVCKRVYPVQTVEQIPGAVRQAFVQSLSGEPGPVAVVVPYNLLIEAADFRVPPPAATPTVIFDEGAFQKAVAFLSDKSQRIGIYAGFGCMDFSEDLAAVAELLQAPVATSVSGKGAISEAHPLAVGWGYGPHASVPAELVFAGERGHPKSGITTLLAIGVKFSEVSTGYYGNFQPKRVIHVDANPCNLGRVLETDICVAADAGAFLGRLKECADAIRRPTDEKLCRRIRNAKADAAKELCNIPPGKCGIDPLAVVAALRKHMPEDGLLFTDVTVTEHLAAEHYKVVKPRTFFNPVDNQSMGWSIPAAIGAQRVHHGRTVATLTGDGCFLMSAMEISTTAREGLPVKFFILDDHAYHYMQMLQKAAYARTTATRLAPINYAALAQAFGVAYQDIASPADLEAKVCGAIQHDGPVLVRISTDYGTRKIRWIEAVRKRYAGELTAAQKARFLARLAGRAINLHPEVND